MGNSGGRAGDDFDSHVSRRTQLLAYRAAEWGGFGFGIAGTQLFPYFFHDSHA